MLDKGYRRIAFLNLDERIIAAQGRKVGAIRAYEKRGESLQNLHIESVIVEQDGKLISRARLAACEVIEQFKPDAILCGQDPMAMEIYFVLQSLGLKVGDDIGIGSFDNWDLIPELLQPSLTTMALPHYEMGRWAFNYLLDERTDLVASKLPFRLISRGSL